MFASERAWRLRDAAVRVVRDCGRWESHAGLRLVVADWTGMRIIYRTPFQRPRNTPEPRTYLHALALATADPDLAYVLEIWTAPRRPTKVWTQVLQVQWSDSGAERRVVFFKEGGWEWPLIKLWVSLS
jgi:hypothetical protein